MSDTALLSSVICGRCKTSLISSIPGTQKYTCKCGLKIRIILQCTHCRKDFLNFPYLVRKTNYCSLACYWTGTNRKELKSCKVCGKQFSIKRYLVEEGFGFYCGKKCWFELFERNKKLVVCKQCQKEFYVINAVYKKGPKFCSKKCRDDSKRDYVTSNCQNCKEDFQLPRGDLNRGRGYFCTRVCYKTFVGETSIEKIVRLALEELKENFVQEAKFGRFHADFYLPERKVVIECDGEYWHRSQLIKERDLRKELFLNEQGLKVVRLTEEEINMGNLDVLANCGYCHY